MSTAGVVYDTAELDRVKNWVNLQSEGFAEQEKETQKKEWGVIIAVSVVSAVVLLVVAKKFLK